MNKNGFKTLYYNVCTGGGRVLRYSSHAICSWGLLSSSPFQKSVHQRRAGQCAPVALPSSGTPIESAQMSNRELIRLYNDVFPEIGGSYIAS